MRLHRQEDANVTDVNNRTVGDPSRARSFLPYSEMLPRPRKTGPVQSARGARRETPRPPDVGPGADEMNAICAAADPSNT